MAPHTPVALLPDIPSLVTSASPIVESPATLNQSGAQEGPTKESTLKANTLMRSF